MLISISGFSQTNSYNSANESSNIHQLTIEPGIGIKPYPISDVLISNVLQWNFNRKFSAISYTYYSYNTAFLRSFNYINTDYSYSLSQKFGVGISLYTKHSSHTFSLMAGIKYDAFKETLNNPAFDKVSATILSTSPDLGILYNLKIGKKKYFFSYRMYLPLYPYPFKTGDVNSADENMANISLEFGLGIRLK